MKKSKKLLGIILSVAMVFGVLFGFSMVSNAAELTGSCGEKATYKFDTDTKTLTISGEGALNNGCDIIDYRIEDDVNSLIIEEGITEIGHYNFEDFFNLKYVYLPEGLTRINEGAFCFYMEYQNVYIENINIPSSVKYIGDDALGAPVVRLHTELDFNVENPDIYVGSGNYGLEDPLMVVHKEYPVGEWKTNEDGTKNYVLEDGTKITDQVVVIAGDLYSFDVDGNVKVGFVNNRYYDLDGSLAYARWIYDEGCWKYVNAYGYQEKLTILEFYRTDWDVHYALDENGVMYSDGWTTVKLSDREEYTIYAYPSGALASCEWLIDDTNQWVYADYMGIIVKDTLERIKGKEYCFDEDGHIRYGWFDISKDPDVIDWRYSDESGALVKNAWIQDSNGWLFLDNRGRIAKNRYVPDSIGYLYVGDEGYPLTGWINLGDEQYPEWHYSDENGYLVSNAWVQDSIGWLYMNEDGWITTDNFAEDSIGTLFLGEDGYIVTNRLVSYDFISVNSSARLRAPRHEEIKYAGPDGYMLNGWQYVTDEYNEIESWMYFDEDYNLVMAEWVMDSTGWCYVDDYGLLVTNGVTYSNFNHDTLYFVDANGHPVGEGWQYDENEDIWVYTDANGVLVRSGWIRDSFGWCYVKEYQMLANNWVNDNGNLYYLDVNGHMYADTVEEIDGKKCIFDANGHFVKTEDVAVG